MFKKRFFATKPNETVVFCDFVWKLLAFIRLIRLFGLV